MKFHILVLVGLLTLNVSAREPEIGDSIPKDSPRMMTKGMPMMVFADSAQMWPAYRISEDKISYSVGVNQNFRVTYVFPNDFGFKTPEGISVGSSLSSVVALAKTNPARRFGWAYYLTLPSGWNAAFIASPKDPTAYPLPTDSKVRYLFKSNWAQVSPSKP